MRPEANPMPGCPTPPEQKKGACILRTPVSMTGAMVSVLRAYFGSTHRACMEKATFLWSPKPEESGIYINDEFNWDLKQVGVRPALIISLEDFTIGNGSDTIGRSGTSGHDPTTGGFNLSSRETGAFTVQCIAKQKLECWSLAWEVKTFLQSYAYEIGRAYRFGSLKVAGIRKPSPMSEGSDYMVSLVGVPFHTINSIHVYKEGLPATSFDLRLDPS